MLATNHHFCYMIVNQLVVAGGEIDHIPLLIHQLQNQD